MSNQEFLMTLNKYSSRSFNDTQQFPVFPWVINDFSCNHHEFKRAKQEDTIYRDITKATAFLGENKKEEIIERF